MKSKISADNLKYSIVLCGYYLLSTLISPNIATALDAESILKRTGLSIVTISNNGRIGSGCIVSLDGFILTDYGLVAEFTRIRAMQAGNDSEMRMDKPKNSLRNGSTSFHLQFSNGATASAGLVAVNERLNVALLTVNISKNPKTIPLGNSNAVRKNEQIAIIGAPISKGGGITFLYGTVTHNKRLREPGVGMFQITSTFHPVYSGSPVLNSEGAVIGIIIGKICKGDNVGFAIPINPVKKFLEEHGVKWQEHNTLIATSNPLDNDNLFITVLFGIPAVGLIIVLLVALGGRRRKAKPESQKARDFPLPKAEERSSSSVQCLVFGARIARLHNSKTGEYYSLSSSDITIGRSSKNNIVISDETVSRQHALINKSEGEYIIQNVSSTNHTYVNGKQIDRYKLQHGDKISMGNTTLVFIED